LTSHDSFTQQAAALFSGSPPGLAVPVDSFPHLQSMNRYIGINLEA
jgi:hypothetical protein